MNLLQGSVLSALSPTLAHCPCTLTSFPDIPVGAHPGRNYPKPSIQRWKLPGAEKSLSKAGSGQAGHPFVLCPGDGGGGGGGTGAGVGSTSGPKVSSGSCKGCSWQGRTDAPRVPSYLFQVPGGQRKVVLLPVTPGDKAGEVGASGASRSGVGDATQPRLCARLDRELPT